MPRFTTCRGGARKRQEEEAKIRPTPAGIAGAPPPGGERGRKERRRGSLRTHRRSRMRQLAARVRGGARAVECNRPQKQCAGRPSKTTCTGANLLMLQLDSRQQRTFGKPLVQTSRL